MGYKCSLIIINNDKDIAHLELLNALGYHQIKEISSQEFNECMNPKSKEIFIGKKSGNTIICSLELADGFLDKAIHQKEKILFEYYPGCEIATLVLHSVVNFWGYSIAKDNEKLRVKAESAEDGTFIDFGEPLEEEKALLSQSYLNDAGERIYQIDGLPDEEFAEDQVGEEFVFNLFARYFETSLDAIDDELFDSKFAGYKISRWKRAQSIKTTNRKWWQFWRSQ